MVVCLKSSHESWKLWTEEVLARTRVCGTAFQQRGFVQQQERAFVSPLAHGDTASHEEPKEPFLAKNKLSLPERVPRERPPNRVCGSTFMLHPTGCAGLVVRTLRLQTFPANFTSLERVSSVAQLPSWAPASQSGQGRNYFGNFYDGTIFFG